MFVIKVERADKASFISFSAEKEHAFKKLVEKLAQHHIDLPVFYWDNDGDRCAIFFEDDLAHAMAQQSNEYMKLFPVHTKTE